MERESPADPRVKAIAALSVIEKALASGTLNPEKQLSYEQAAEKLRGALDKTASLFGVPPSASTGESTTPRAAIAPPPVTTPYDINGRSTEGIGSSVVSVTPEPVERPTQIQSSQERTSEIERRPRGRKPREKQELSLNEPSEYELSETESEMRDIDLEFSGNYVSEPIVTIYLRDVGRFHLLTAEQEVELAKQKDEGMNAEMKLVTGVPDEEERIHLGNAIAQGKTARETLTNSNLRLVISVARKYMGRGLPFMDLIQEGNIGLQRGVDKYDWKKGYRFSTHAYWWIRQAVTKAVADQGGTIRIPVHMYDVWSNVNRVYKELTEAGREAPSHESLAEALGKTPDQLNQIIQQFMLPVSLDQVFGEDQEGTLYDVVSDGRKVPNVDILAQSTEDEVVSLSLTVPQEVWNEVLGALSERERRVIGARLGLVDGKRQTINEIGQFLGISREMVRLIEAEALTKLKKQKLRLAPYFYSREEVITPDQKTIKQKPTPIKPQLPEITVDEEPNHKEAFQVYLLSVRSRAQRNRKSVAEIVAEDFAGERVNLTSAQVAGEPRDPSEPYSFITAYGELIYYPDRLTVVSPLKPEGTITRITKTEGKILEKLIADPNSVKDVETMFPEWTLGNGNGSHLLRVHAARLRQKLGDTDTKRKLIYAIPGRGYSLTPNERTIEKHAASELDKR